MKAYLTYLSPGNVSYIVASYGAKIFVAGLILVTVGGVLVFVFLGLGITKEIPQAGVTLQTVSEARMQKALEALNINGGEETISPLSQFD